MANPSSKLAGYKNIIEADGHMLEPPDVWEKYIDPQYRDRVLRLRVGSDGNEYLQLNGRPSKFFNIKALTLLGGMGRNADQMADSVTKTYKEAAPFGSVVARD